MDITEDPLLSTLWICSLSNKKKSRNYLEIDISKACNAIETNVPALSLYKISNLLYGTVLIFKHQCEIRFKETQIIRSSVQRINEVLQSAAPAQKISKNAKQIILKDDAAFDINLGLLEWGHKVSLNSLLKDLESGDSSAAGLGNTNGDWRRDEGVREVSVSDNEIAMDNFDLIFDRNKVQTDEDIWDKELDFEFDYDGNAIDEQGKRIHSRNPSHSYSVQSRPPTHNSNESSHLTLENEQPESSAAGMDGEYEMPDFGIPEVGFEFETAPEEMEIIPNDSLKTKKQRSSTTKNICKQKKRRIMYDRDIYITVQQMRENRDKYLEFEFEKRINHWKSLDKDAQLSIFNPHDIFTLIRSGIYPTPENSNGDQFTGAVEYLENYEMPDFEVASMDATVRGRGRHRDGNGNDNGNRDQGRSASVSSVEEGRRALASQSRHRNSSSFQIDMDFQNLEDPLDVLITQSSIEIPVDIVHDIVQFELDLPTRASFSEICPLSEKHQMAAHKFNMVLQLATKNQLEIRLTEKAIGKSQWEVLSPQEIEIAKKG